MDKVKNLFLIFELVAVALFFTGYEVIAAVIGIAIKYAMQIYLEDDSMNMLMSVGIWILMVSRVAISVYIFFSSYVNNRKKGYLVGLLSYVFPIVALVIYKTYIVKLYGKTTEQNYYRTEKFFK